MGGGVTIGADPGSPTMPDYDSPCRLNGTINKVWVDVSGDRVEDYEERMRIYLARQ